MSLTPRELHETKNLYPKNGRKGLYEANIMPSNELQGFVLQLLYPKESALALTANLL